MITQANGDIEVTGWGWGRKYWYSSC